MAFEMTTGFSPGLLADESIGTVYGALNRQLQPGLYLLDLDVGQPVQAHPDVHQVSGAGACSGRRVGMQADLLEKGCIAGEGDTQQAFH